MKNEVVLRSKDTVVQVTPQRTTVAVVNTAEALVTAGLLLVGLGLIVDLLRR